MLLWVTNTLSTLQSWTKMSQAKLDYGRTGYAYTFAVIVLEKKSITWNYRAAQQATRGVTMLCIIHNYHQVITSWECMEIDSVLLQTVHVHNGTATMMQCRSLIWKHWTFSLLPLQTMPCHHTHTCFEVTNGSPRRDEGGVSISNPVCHNWTPGKTPGERSMWLNSPQTSQASNTQATRFNPDSWEVVVDTSRRSQQLLKHAASWRGRGQFG